MPVELELQAFEPLVGDAFRAKTSEGQSFDLVLAAVEPTPYGDPSTYNGRRMPFSLLFRAEDGTLHPQQTFSLAHAEAGETELFLVPLGPEGDAMRYEAVVS